MVELTSDTKGHEYVGQESHSKESFARLSAYDAEYTRDEDENIVSHDPILNTDGEALCRFLRDQTSIAPKLYVHCSGHHIETHTRWVEVTDSQGQDSLKLVKREENICDFDFSIDMSQHSTGIPAIIWSVADSIPAYRGSVVREVGSLQSGRKRKANSDEIKSFDTWAKERYWRGLPPWMESLKDTGTTEETSALKSSESLRQWANEYCASDRYLKEFVFNKVLYGWNMQRLESAIRSIILSSPYSGTVVVDFERLRGGKVYIRPDNMLSRLLSYKLLNFVFYPFLWVFKRFYSRGGGSWEVCGAAYAINESFHGADDDHTHFAPQIPLRGVSTPVGMRRLIGEDDWCRQWGPTILRAVVTRYHARQPLYAPIVDDHTDLLKGS